jgi:hypothetical protein
MEKRDGLNSLSRTESLSVEEVRSLATFKDWDEDKILELIAAIKVLSKIMYNNFARDKEIGKVIAIDISNKQNIAA